MFNFYIFFEPETFTSISILLCTYVCLLWLLPVSYMHEMLCGPLSFAQNTKTNYISVTSFISAVRTYELNEDDPLKRTCTMYVRTRMIGAERINESADACR